MEEDGTCKYRAKIMGHIRVPTYEAANIQALSHGSVGRLLEVTDRKHSYDNGILRDTTSNSQPNHVVVGVGYTPNHVVVGVGYTPNHVVVGIGYRPNHVVVGIGYTPNHVVV